MLLRVWKDVSKHCFRYSSSLHKNANVQARVQLAAAYRGLNSYGLNEGVCNHLSAIAPSKEIGRNIMLIIPHGLHWSEVTPSNLIGVDQNNDVVEGTGKPEITALCIHMGIYSEHPEVRCIMHTHMPYATSLTCLQNPTLRMIHQNSTRFHERIAYDFGYGGLGTSFEEGRRLGKALKDKCVLFMGNHGVITTANSIAVAFDNMYYLERAAMVQVLASSTQVDLKEMELEIVQLTSKQIWQDLDEYAESHLQTVIRRLMKECPDFNSDY
ncbi:uncharacterized protein LOC129222865 [Uloborus diversus]|uniref:uncharacterized protein LOC129222865 n=1 Tax=Uloborus diversus TaxID=327109 RepID=UPI00240A9C25|nr:uncharacterized protein LOC129222865 [Uloborus diversus]XP_054713399.1 uncharacterized protein LOC129222865 [Uloborus diversus]